MEIPQDPNPNPKQQTTSNPSSDDSSTSKTDPLDELLGKVTQEEVPKSKPKPPPEDPKEYVTVSLKEAEEILTTGSNEIAKLLGADEKLSTQIPMTLLKIFNPDNKVPLFKSGELANMTLMERAQKNQVIGLLYGVLTTIWSYMKRAGGGLFKRSDPEEPTATTTSRVEEAGDLVTCPQCERQSAEVIKEVPKDGIAVVKCTSADCAAESMVRIEDVQ